MLKAGDYNADTKINSKSIDFHVSTLNLCYLMQSTLIMSL